MKKKLIWSISFFLLIQHEVVYALKCSTAEMSTDKGGFVYLSPPNYSPQSARDTVYIKQGESVNIYGSASGASCSMSNIKWYKDNIEVTGWNSSGSYTTYTVSSEGAYKCSFLFGGGVGSVGFSGTIVILFDNTTGINKNDENDLSVNVFPNPSDQIFNVEITSNENMPLKIEVINILGEIILLQEISEARKEDQIELDLSSYENGIYFLVIKGTSDKILASRKLLLLH